MSCKTDFIQAFHWLTPHDKFFKEVKRMMNPLTGVFCIVGYTRPHLTLPALNQLFLDFYNNTLGSLKKPGETIIYLKNEYNIT